MHNTLRRPQGTQGTEKSTATAEGISISPESSSFTSPRGWRYYSPQLGRLTLPYYASPVTQLIIISFVCFLCPGMFNALSGMGGGGQVNASAGDKANVALYSTFAVVGFFAGTITNKLGIRTALSFGGLG